MKSGQEAKRDFISRFQKGNMPENIKEISISVGSSGIGVAHLIKQAGLVSSTSEAFRMIKQGAVKLDGNRIEDREKIIKSGSTHICQVGKRKFIKVHMK